MDEAEIRSALDEFLWTSSFDAPLASIRPHVSFPSDEVRSLYLDGVEDRPEDEVKELLWRMLSASTSKGDALSFGAMVEGLRPYPVTAKQVLNSGSLKRMRWRERTGIGEAWEGMTWALEMLQIRPGAAVDALNLYLEAQHGLPDDRIFAIADAIDIIRTKWIGNPKTVDERVAQLKSLDPRKFEALIAAWWEHMGYEVALTQSTRDGGYDVHATRELLQRKEKVIIECKRHERNIPVGVVRELNGLSDPDFAHARLVIVTTAGFTKPAVQEAKRNRRTELIAGRNLVPQLNEHLGWDWPRRLERITRNILERAVRG